MMWCYLQGSYEGDQDEALIAVDFTAEAPYYKVVWIYDMNPGTPLNTSKTCNSTLSMDFGGPPCKYDYGAGV